MNKGILPSTLGIDTNKAPDENGIFISSFSNLNILVVFGLTELVPTHLIEALKSYFSSSLRLLINIQLFVTRS